MKKISITHFRYKRLCELEIAEHGDELAGGQQNIFLRLLEGGSSKRDGATGRRISDAGNLGFDEDFDDEDDNARAKTSNADHQSAPTEQTKEDQ